jgi:hypothetical protein
MTTDFMMKAGGILRRVKVAAARYIAATALGVYFTQEVKTLKAGCKTFPKFRGTCKRPFARPRALKGKLKVSRSTIL